MTFNFRDHYFHKAKREQFLARAVYKLQEIQNKYKLLKVGDRVLDLGAAPGSWLQLAGRIVGPAGLVVGVDLKAFGHAFPKHVVTIQRDIMEAGFQEELVREYAPFDVILSDMAPSTSGIKVADSARSALLVERAMELAHMTLKANGHLLVKIFQGSEFHQLLVQFKREYGLVKVVKPEASRKESKEIYILAMRFKKP